MKIPLKKVRIIRLCLIVLGAVIGYIGVCLESIPLVAVCFVVMMGGAVFHFLFYRCPHCGEFLDRNTGEFCPHCGQRV